jgi:hypothetical protein
MAGAGTRSRHIPLPRRATPAPPLILTSIVLAFGFVVTVAVSWMTFNVVGGYEADIHPFSGTISGGDRVALWRFYLFTFYRPRT